MFPLRLFGRQLFPPGGRQAVIFELAIAILGHLPFRCDPAFSFQPVEGRIKRSMLHLQDVVGSAAYVLGDVVSMRGPEEQGPENEHVERSLQQFDSIGEFVGHGPLVDILPQEQSRLTVYAESLYTLSLPHMAVAFGAAFLAGAINSVAGGGTLVSFPTLIWLGLPSVAANATSTVGIWPAAWSSMLGYRRELRATSPRMLVLVVPSVIGGVAGARHAPR